MLKQGLLGLKPMWGDRFQLLEKAMKNAVKKAGNPQPAYQWSIPNIDQYIATHMANRDTPVQGVIMAMENSTTFAVVLKPEMFFVHVSLTGVEGPSRRMCGSEEKYFNHARGLFDDLFIQREVDVLIEGGLEGYSQLLFVSLLYDEAESGSKDRSMAEYLARQGAVFVDKKDHRYTLGIEKLLNAETAAMEEGLWLWQQRKIGPGNHTSLARTTPEDVVLKTAPLDVQTGRDVGSFAATAQRLTKLNLGGLHKKDLIKTLSTAQREELDGKAQFKDRLAATKQRGAQESKIKRSAEEEEAAKFQLIREATQKTLHKYIAAVHARAIMERVDRHWTGSRDLGTEKWPRWDIFVPEHAAELMAVLINHEQVVPGPVFSRLVSIMRRVYDRCSIDIHSLELLGGRAVIDSDYVGEQAAKILMALCVCLGIKFTYYRNGVPMNSWRVASVDGFPFFGTAESDETIF